MMPFVSCGERERERDYVKWKQLCDDLARGMHGMLHCKTTPQGIDVYIFVASTDIAALRWP
jgi:hypothetical protein